MAHAGSDRFHYTYGFVAYGYAFYRAWHAAVFYVQIAGAYAAECNAHDGVAAVERFGVGFFSKAECAFVYVGVCFHLKSSFGANLRHIRENVKIKACHGLRGRLWMM